MKQLVQNLRTGEALVWDVPAPTVASGHVLVAVSYSLVSAGTERMVVSFAEKNLVQKARSRPDLVKQVVEKAQRDGVLTTLDSVRNRLEAPMALGYSCSGVVVEVGEGVEEFAVGDAVACAGAGYAMHAEVVSVPHNLVAKVQDASKLESAAYTTLGAIALQGIRLADVRLGEVVGVVGLGLVGQLTVQMLKAAGCIVVGVDIQPARAELASSLGADAVATTAQGFVDLCLEYTRGHGADSVLITADTRSNEPVATAGNAARKKGIVVAVGAVGMTIPRKIYYDKELDFRISSSYGPGRYDPVYEEEGNDYPYAYVRWTENRNMQAFLNLVAQGAIQTDALTTHRFSIEEAAEAYQLILGTRPEPFLGVVLTYPGMAEMAPEVRTVTAAGTVAAGTVAAPAQEARLAPATEHVRLGVLGAGGFATSTLLPALKSMPGVSLVGISSAKGVSARSAADRFGFVWCTADNQRILDEPSINTVAILTRHDLHAQQVIQGLQSGKRVFVEKPLCLTVDELESIRSTHEGLRQSGGAPWLMVGYNRRFAPFVVELGRQIKKVNEPLLISLRVNAGYIPADHWTQGAAGGGRLLGEVCHFIDLAIFLAGARVREIVVDALPDMGKYREDNLSLSIAFENGSLASIAYVANGNRATGKEYFEVFGGGYSARLDDYRTLAIAGPRTSVKRKAWLRQAKGHREEWQAIVQSIQAGAEPPISFDESYHSTLATLGASLSLRERRKVTIAGDQLQ